MWDPAKENGLTANSVLCITCAYTTLDIASWRPAILPDTVKKGSAMPAPVSANHALKQYHPFEAVPHFQKPLPPFVRFFRPTTFRSLAPVHKRIAKYVFENEPAPRGPIQNWTASNTELDRVGDEASVCDCLTTLGTSRESPWGGYSQSTLW